MMNSLSVHRLLTTKACCIGQFPAAFCTVWLISNQTDYVASLCDCLSMFITALSRTQSSWDGNKIGEKNHHPVCMSQSWIKVKLQLQFLPNEVNNTPPTGRQRRWMRGWRELTCRQPWQRIYYTAEDTHPNSQGTVRIIEGFDSDYIWILAEILYSSDTIIGHNETKTVTSKTGILGDSRLYNTV